MPVQANALVSLADAKTYLNIAGTSDDAKLEKVIDRASDLIEQHCQRPLKEATYTNLRLRGSDSPILRPRARPINIVSAITIKVDGTTQTIWKQESDGDPANFDVIVGSGSPEMPNGQRDHFYRAGAWKASSSQPYNVLLSFTGGLATIPDDLQEAALLIVQKLWRDQQKQLAEVQAVTMPSGSVTLFDTVLPRRALWLLGAYRELLVA